MVDGILIVVSVGLSSFVTSIYYINKNRLDELIPKKIPYESKFEDLEDEVRELRAEYNDTVRLKYLTNERDRLTRDIEKLNEYTGDLSHPSSINTTSGDFRTDDGRIISQFNTTNCSIRDEIVIDPVNGGLIIDPTMKYRTYGGHYISEADFNFLFGDDDEDHSLEGGNSSEIRVNGDSINCSGSYSDDIYRITDDLPF